MDETHRCARHNVVGVFGTLDESGASLAALQDAACSDVQSGTNVK